jgi:lipopolysaccharide/colanic/teichoic acid biosynthesis glycosyltransferase
MLASDPEYVCTCTVVLDLKILARTPKQILFPQRLF